MSLLLAQPGHAAVVRRRLLLGVERTYRSSGPTSEFDPDVWSGRALQEDFVELAAAVLHQCIRPLIGACGAPGHHGYQRACVLVNGQASNGAIWVTSVRMRSEDRTSISSHPLADLGWKLLIGLRHRLLLISRSSFVRAMGRSFVPARRASIASRAGAVKAGRRAWVAAGSGVARRRLDRAEHGREDQAGRTTPASSVLVSSKARPLASTAQAMRASLLASAIASTL
jgi:hypothetical protein